MRKVHLVRTDSGKYGIKACDTRNYSDRFLENARKYLPKLKTCISEVDKAMKLAIEMENALGCKGAAENKVIGNLYRGHNDADNCRKSLKSAYDIMNYALTEYWEDVE